MKEVCVITGGGSGMGLATAKYIKDRLVIISGRTESKLAAACEELKKEGVEAIYKTCDTSSRASVAELAKFASEQGVIFRINAMGTVYVNEEFQKYMDKGSVICDVASNSAYALPGFMTKAVKFAYKWADKDEDKFVNFFMKLAGKISDDYMSAGMAYSFSKNFVTWYAAKSAFDLGPRGIRVCSVSPGLIATAMGNAEVEHGGDLIKKACEERMGEADELGYCIATCADPRNGYLAAVDVLADGGSTRGNAEFKHDPLAPLKMAGIIK